MDIEAIAKGLTDLEREWITGWQGPAGAAFNCVAGDLLRKGLLKSIADWGLNETGLAVRDFLKCQQPPTRLDALRDLVATLWCAGGCACCRDDDAWEKASNELAELFGVPRYEDGSGYDWYSVRDAALQEQGK